jgi:hypothetical protein
MFSSTGLSSNHRGSHAVEHICLLVEVNWFGVVFRPRLHERGVCDLGARENKNNSWT